MYRPPPQPGHPYGGAAGSPAADGNLRYPNFHPQNPNFAFPFPFSPQLFFQNPNFPNPRFPNPSFPNPNSHNSPSPKPRVTMERIEGAVAKAQRDLCSAGESVSAWKVSQAALVSLQVDSWSSLGLQLQDVPSLRRLLATEGKVSAFIHCFVGARKIVSLYDLEVALCNNEGVERFEELGLGPLSCHPLAKHYFSVPSDMTEVFKISSEEIIASLCTFMDKSPKWPIAAEEFLGFLAEQNSVSAKEKLGVRIQSLGMHLSFIKEAKKAEKTVLHKTFEVLKHSTKKSKIKEESHSTKRRSNKNVYSQKRVLDARFDYISGRIKSFSSLCETPGGKHTRFCSSAEFDTDDDEDEDGSGGGNAGGGVITLHCNSSQNKDKDQHVSSCPYPSTSEEMVRLGLSIETGEKAFSNYNQMLDYEDKKFSGKKRKRKQEEESKNSSSTCKSRPLRKKEFKASSSGRLLSKLTKKDSNSSSLGKSPEKERIIDLENEKKLKQLILTSDSMEKFITTWREVCQEHSVAEVLDMMLNFYMTTATERKKARTRKIFTSYPGIGLLNVAVTSIKHGVQGSVYDIVQAFGEHEDNDTESTPADVIKIGHFEEDLAVDNKKGTGVTVNDIIENITKYFRVDPTMSRQRDFPSGKQFAIFKMFRDCETWLATQFSVKNFVSLGHGDLFSFLEQHASLLPEYLHSAFDGKMSNPSCLVTMRQTQLGFLLSQVESNRKDNCEISKSDVSLLLRRQFPTISFDIVGDEPGKCSIELNLRSKSHCVQYSATLLGKQLTPDLMICNEKVSLEARNVERVQLVNSYEHISAKDAIGCLLKAPMMSDLLSWSHWDLVYASSLGPLSSWLLNEVEIKELLCLATIDGRIIRIDHSANVDGFLEAIIDISPFQVALKLLSLLSLYRGVNNAPLSLLKCYAQRGIGVIIKNYSDSNELSNNMEALMHKKAHTLDAFSFDLQGISEAHTLTEPLCRTRKAIITVSRFILECLDNLPSEFRSFGSEILVSGLQSVAKDAPLFILHECRKTDQRVMLHNIGLSLGIPEWIDDHRLFSSSMALPEDSPQSCKSGGSLNCVPNISEEPSSTRKVTDAFQAKVEEEFNAEIGIGSNDILFANGHCQGFDKTCEWKDSNRATGVNSSIPEDRSQEARSIVESIRREEFGLDADLNYGENCMLKKQHARLGRALHCLSQELYSQDSHLLLELVQNADDNIYPTDVDPTLVFILQDSGIIVFNNELGFSAQNIRALCDIGNSTKKGSAGYIGHKGIGFKSVFRVRLNGHVVQLKLLHRS